MEPSLAALIYRYLDQRRTLFGDELLLGPPRPLHTQPWEAALDPAAGKVELHRYYQEIKSCQKCPLGATRTNFVFGVGNPSADLVFIGEAPGRDEDLKGEPFVGRAGKLLDQILAAINLDRRQVYILNVLKCRPPRNRDPLTTEVESCEPYLVQQLKIIQPKLIVALGRVAAQTILKVSDSLKHMRSQVYSYNGIELRVTYHPAALLRNQAFKKPTWEDFQVFRDRYLELTSEEPAAEPVVTDD